MNRSTTSFLLRTLTSATKVPVAKMTKQTLPQFVIRDSIIRRMTRAAVKHDAVNLGQGFPNERPCDQMVISAALALLTGSREDVSTTLCGLVNTENGNKTIKDILSSIEKSSSDSLNQYTFPFGTPQLRNSISRYYERIYNISVDPETEVTVTLGATEAVSVALRAAVEPGHAVVIIQPYHEMYVNQALVFGIHPIIVNLRDCSDTTTSPFASNIWQLDFDEIEKAIDTSPVPVKGFILNSPHNPTGKVFTDDELRRLCKICFERNILIITDEIYEHIIFGGRFEGRQGPHQTVLWSWGHEYRQNVIIVNSISKTGSATGWRVGWMLSPSHLTEIIRAIHDNMTMQAPTPLQYGTEALLNKELSFFFNDLPAIYKTKFEVVKQTLQDVGFTFAIPEGSYYIFASYNKISPIAHLNSTEAAHYLIKSVGVASVPDSSQLLDGQTEKYLRFAFCKTERTLSEAMRRLQLWKENNYNPISR